LIKQDRDFEALWQSRRLKSTWKAIRAGLKKCDARDSLDYLEFDLFVDDRIKILRKAVTTGSYTPAEPGLFELAKERGAFRVMSVLTAEDALVYRHLVDDIYRRAQRDEPGGVYFAQGQPTVPVGPECRKNDLDSYEDGWQLWIRYHQYRTKTLLNTIAKVLVVTDVTNYFESIQHELLLEHLAPLGLSRKATGLLGRLLERFKPASGHSPTPRVGLPVDQHDCSRALAHIYLFEHDRRVTGLVGKDRYVRWMDDQNLAVESLTDARIVVRKLTSSLSEQRLVLNTGKTRFLDAPGVNNFFHLDSNDHLDEIDKKLKKGASDSITRAELSTAWSSSLVLENHGNWSKILKRFYGMAGRLNEPFLKTRALSDLIAFPLLAPRIFEYYAALQDFSGLLELFSELVESKESLYESAEAAFFEGILLCNIPNDLRSKFREFTYQWLTNQNLGTGRPYSRGSAALCLYWLGDKRSVSAIEKVLLNEAHNYPATTSRALVAAYTALAPEKIDVALKICARLANKELASFAQFVDVIMESENIVCSLPRVSCRRPYSSQISIFEARTWLRLEILTLAKSQGIRNWLKSQKATIEKNTLGDCEKRVFKRWAARL